MEVYAGFLEYTDHHVGRLLDALEGAANLLDDTLIYYIIGDNGASAEGTLNGTFNEMINFNGAAALETPEFLMERIDKLGGPESYNHYAVGWAHAMNTPYQWTKQVASHWGGTRNGTIVHWPNGHQGEGRDPHAVPPRDRRRADDARGGGLPQPLSVNGVQQQPIEGVSMLYSFNDAKAAERHETQYFEMFGNRGIYHKGWTAVTRHKTPWLLVGETVPAFDDDVWELYDTNKDWSQANDLAKEMPEKLHELQRLWLIEATRYNVLPLDDRVAERLNPDLAGRPVLIKGKTPDPLRRHGPAVRELGRQHQEQVALGDRRDRRAGGRRRGRDHRAGRQHRRLGLYAKGGKLKYCYNLLGVKYFYVEAAADFPRASTRCAWSSPTTAAAWARAARRRSSSTARRSDGSARSRPRRRWSSPPTTAATSAATPDRRCRRTTGRAGTSSTGRVKGVQIAIAEAAENADHLVSPEDAVRVAMARQ